MPEMIFNATTARKVFRITWRPDDLTLSLATEDANRICFPKISGDDDKIIVDTARDAGQIAELLGWITNRNPRLVRDEKTYVSWILEEAKE